MRASGVRFTVCIYRYFWQVVKPILGSFGAFQIFDITLYLEKAGRRAKRNEIGVSGVSIQFIQGTLTV